MRSECPWVNQVIWKNPDSFEIIWKICSHLVFWKIQTVLNSSVELADIWKNADSFEIMGKIGNHLENLDSFEIIWKIGNHLEKFG